MHPADKIHGRPVVDLQAVVVEYAELENRYLQALDPNHYVIAAVARADNLGCYIDRLVQAHHAHVRPGVDCIDKARVRADDCEFLE